MNLRRDNPPLARRLLGLYLLFSLASIACLGIGLVALYFHVLVQDHERELVSRIDEVRALLQNDQSQNAGTGAQTLISLLGAEDWVAYVGVVGTDDRYLAHTRPSRIGQTADPHAVAKDSVPVIERRTVSRGEGSRHEYWATLNCGPNCAGYLQVGVVAGTASQHASRLMGWLPFAAAAPFSLLIFGSVCLISASRTSAKIERQLQGVSANPLWKENQLQPLSEPNSVAAGWNRLLEQVFARRERTDLKEKLHQSVAGLQTQRLAHLLNGLPDGIALTDDDGRISFANQPFAVLTGRTDDGNALRGKRIHEVLPPEFGSSQTSPHEFHESRPVIKEIHLGAELADGVLRIGRYPLPPGDGTTSRQCAWLIRDITQQKLAEEMHEQFLQSATHELRTPLANIKAYAETLALNAITDLDQQKHFLNTINSEATRLARFVDELLNVSQMEAGSLSLYRQETDFERVLLEVADKVRPQMQQKQIQFEVQFPAKLPKLSLDKDKFMAALVNLLGNAAKYTPDGGRVAFKVTSSPQEVTISVEDTGIGIAADELPKIGTKFFRSADERVRDIPGSGLGLSFTSEIVRLHGAKLSVHSELNKGTRFSIAIPLVQEPAHV